MSGPGGEILDTRGSLCPQPILDLAAKMAGLAEGEALWVLSDDAAFDLDLRAWCAAHGHELLSLEVDGSLRRARVRKR